MKHLHYESNNVDLALSFLNVTKKQSFQDIFLPVIHVTQRAAVFSNKYFLAKISHGRMFYVMDCPLKHMLVLYHLERMT